MLKWLLYYRKSYVFSESVLVWMKAVFWIWCGNITGKNHLCFDMPVKSVVEIWYICAYLSYVLSVGIWYGLWQDKALHDSKEIKASFVGCLIEVK